MKILITGSTDGIGKETARQLLSMGHTIILHGRNSKRVEKALEDFPERENILTVTGDLSLQTELHLMADQLHNLLDNIDVLINNAGIYQRKRELTPDGLEKTFAVNHMAPFILTNLLLDLLEKSEDPRVVTVSSMIHSGSIDFDNLQGEKYFNGSYAYSLSKLCNILFTYELAERVKEQGITSNCLHPGVIDTKLLRSGWGGMGAPVSEGAKTPVYLATSSEVRGITGKYFVDRKISRSKPITYNKEVRQKLWSVSESLWKRFPG